MIMLGLRCALLTSVIAALVLYTGAPNHAPATPNILPTAPTIVSLDHCADQYALAFISPEQILAVSPHANRSYSYLRNHIGGIRQIPPRAEAIAVLNPDIVLRSYGGTGAITAFLQSRGTQTVQLPLQPQKDDIWRMLPAIAEQLGSKKSASPYYQQALTQLAILKKNTPTQPKGILYITAQGGVAGKNTHIDWLIGLSGHQNVAGHTGWRRLSLEELIKQKPDALILSYFQEQENFSDHWSIARHERLRAFIKTFPRHHLGTDLTACPAWYNLQAALQMQQFLNKKNTL